MNPVMAFALDVSVDLRGYWFGYIVGAYQGTPYNWFLFLLASTASLLLRRVWVAPLPIGLLLGVAYVESTDPKDFQTILGVAAPIAVYATLFHFFIVKVFRLLNAPSSSRRHGEGDRP